MLIVNKNIVKKLVCEAVTTVVIYLAQNMSFSCQNEINRHRFECACFSYWGLVMTLVTLHAKIIDFISNLVMFVIFFLFSFFFFLYLEQFGATGN